MNITLRVGRRLRRRASVTTGTVVAAGMMMALMAPGAVATGGGSSGGGNLDCPAGTTLLAKLNVNEGTGSHEYEFEFGDEVVTATPSDEFSGSFTVASGFTVSQVIVKGSGVDAKRDTDGNLTFDGEGLLNGGGNQPTISNVKFCGATDGATVARVANDGGGGGGGGGGGLKVFVCTYVGTPGVDERLQPGNNPISMSVKAIPGGLPVNIGDEFTNGQVRSVVIAFDTRTDAEPSVDDCPTVPMPVLTKSAGPESGSVVRPGDEIEYTVTVANTGELALDDQTLVDMLPERWTVVEGEAGISVESGEVSLDEAFGEITWEFDLPGETSYVMTYTVIVDADAADGDVLTNTATWGGLVKFTTHTVNVPVQGGETGVPMLTKSAGPESGSEVRPGSKIEYTVTVANTGKLALDDQTLVDTLPEGVTVVEGEDGLSLFSTKFSPSFGEVSLDEALGEITWEFDLPGETSYVMIYTVIVDADAADGDVLTNTATWGELVKLTTHTVKVDVVAPAAVTPIAPMAIPSVCVGNASNGASAVEIFPATGVEYSIGSTVLAAKITDVADGTNVTVVARPTANNVFAGAPSVSYVLTFGTPNCTPASGVVVNPPPAPAVVVAAPVRVIPSVTQAAAQPRALARTGVELWSVALTAGLLLAAGAAMVGLTTTGNAKGRHRA